jgi:hypothetical protein
MAAPALARDGINTTPAARITIRIISFFLINNLRDA